MNTAKRAALFLETALWHWFVVGGALFAGGGAFAIASLVCVVNALAVVVFEGAGSWRASGRSRRLRILAWYVALVRFGTGLSQGPGLWSAYQVEPLVTGACAAAAAALLLAGLGPARRSWLTRPTRAGTLLVATALGVNGAAFAGRLGVDCAAVLAQPGITPLVLFERVPSRAPDDPLLDTRCGGVRMVNRDPASGALFVACGPEVEAGEVDAVLRLDPDHPGERVALVDRPAVEALPIPGSDVLAISVLGRDVVRFVDRDTFAPRGELPLRRPLAMAWDARSGRLLVGHEGDPGCVAAFDPLTATRLDGSVGGLFPTTSELRDVYPQVEKSKACMPDDCSPSKLVTLPESGLVVVGNSAATCTWQAMSYNGLERVFAREWLFPSRDLKRSPFRDELWVAVSFTGNLAVVDPKTFDLVREVRAGYGAMWFDWLDRDELVVGDYVTGELRRIDAVTGAIRARSHVGSKIRALSFDTRRQRVYAGSRCGVFAVDPAVALRPG